MTIQFDVTMTGEIHLDLIFHGLPENAPFDPVIRGANFPATQVSSSAPPARLLLPGLASARPRIWRAETFKSSLSHQAAQKQERIFRA